MDFNKAIVTAAQHLQNDYNNKGLLPTAALEMNKAIRDNNNKMLELPFPKRQGILHIADVYSGDEPITIRQATEAGWRHEAKWELTKLRRLIPGIWGRKGITPTISNPDELPSRATLRYIPKITINGNILQKKDMTYRNLILHTRHFINTQTPRLRQKAFETLHLDIETATPFAYIKKLFNNTRSRDFCFRLLNDVLYANKELHRFGYRNGANCGWCQEEIQTTTHLLWECPSTAQVVQTLIGTDLSNTKLDEM